VPPSSTLAFGRAGASPLIQLLPDDVRLEAGTADVDDTASRDAFERLETSVVVLAGVLPDRANAHVG